MRTQLQSTHLDADTAQRAEAILRSCVHCGFCNATCPTYQLQGDELDGPRGRIYLIKEMLEGGPASEVTRQHLDRCLTCLSCETTCPSGVQYGQLLEIGREQLEERSTRPWKDRVLRRLLRFVLPYRGRVRLGMGAVQLLRRVLPGSVIHRLLPKDLLEAMPERMEAMPRHADAKPERSDATSERMDAESKHGNAVPDRNASPQTKPSQWPEPRHARRVLALTGCVQAVVAPQTNAAAARLLDRHDISLVQARGDGCCGAVSLHLGAAHEAKDQMRRNIRAWNPHLERGAEGIVATSSACAATLREYGRLLADDPRYAEQARRVSERVVDLASLVATLPRGKVVAREARIAFHAPCTLQHGLRQHETVQNLLRSWGFQLAPVRDAHLCCGAAGTYAVLQPELSQKLRRNKLDALQAQSPDTIATANIGCQLHLQQETQTPVRHWIELVEAADRGAVDRHA